MTKSDHTHYFIKHFSDKYVTIFKCKYCEEKIKRISINFYIRVENEISDKNNI